jgi:hypothetical protein
MTEIESLLAKYKHGKPDIKTGSLRFFGDSFGRPGDNQHTIVKIDYQAQDDCLIIRFNAGETLFVWQAKGIKADKDNFLIQSANRVRWEWFYYGRPQTPENLYYQQYTVKDGEVKVTHNIN